MVNIEEFLRIRVGVEKDICYRVLQYLLNNGVYYLHCFTRHSLGDIIWGISENWITMGQIITAQISLHTGVGRTAS